MEFILYGGEGGALVEGLENFKYLGRPLDQTDENWTTIRQNIKQERTVWESLGKLLIREGKYTRVEAMFYRKVAQAVLFFDLETWVILEVTERKVEGHIHGFYEAYHRDAVALEGRREVGESQGGSSAGSGGNSVGDELHRETTGEGGTLGDTAANF